MGVGKSMKTFISAMTEQTGMGGYGSKIKSTPMGPFKWNDLTQLWENVNNGMVMNNVSFQDMFMMDYDTIGGGGEILKPLTLTPPDWGNLTGATATSTIFWSSESGPQSDSANANRVFFTNIPQSGLSIILGITGSGTIPQDLYVKQDAGSDNLYSGAQSITTDGTSLRIGFSTPATFTNGSGSGTITVTDIVSSTILDTINWSIVADASPTLTPSNWGNLSAMNSTNLYWASTTGPQLSLASATTVTFSSINQPINITLSTSNTTGTALGNIRYRKNSGSVTIYSSPISISSGDTLIVAVNTPGLGTVGSGNVDVVNASTSTTLYSIPYDFAIE